MQAGCLIGECVALAPDRSVAHLFDCRSLVPRAVPAPSYALLEQCRLMQCRPLMLSGLGGLEWVAALELLFCTAVLDDGDAVVMQMSATPASAVWAFRVSARAQPFAAVTVHEASVRPASASVADWGNGLDAVGPGQLGEALRVPGPGLVRSIVLAGEDGGKGVLRVAAMARGEGYDEARP